MMALGTGFNCAVGQVLKGICRIPRPWLRNENLQPVQGALAAAGGYSFPSGHTIRAGSAYGIFAIQNIRNKHKAAATISLILFLLIAFSRNWLGVHTPEDVLVGCVIWIANYFILKHLLVWAERGKNRDWIIGAVACLIASLPMFWLGCQSNVGACFGFFLGWILERRTVKFSVPDKMTTKLFTGITGSIGVILIAKVLQDALATIMAPKYAAFIMSFFMGLFIMVIWPALFTRLKGRNGTAILSLFLCLFLLIPQTIHAEQQSEPQSESISISNLKPGTIAVIGHRGFAAAAPENTVPAFEAAIKQKVDYIELDVQLSSDRQIVVCHDNNLQRLTGRDIPLNTLTREELKNTDVGSYFSPEYAGTGIPTLEEVLDLIKDTNIRIYLELKDIGEDPLFPGMVLNLTKEKGLKDRCVFASFQYNYLKAIKEQDPNADILLNTDRTDTALPQELPADYYGIKCASFSREQAEAIHQAGAKAFIWNVNTKDEIIQVIKDGADGICSNSPDLVQETLLERQTSNPQKYDAEIRDTVEKINNANLTLVILSDLHYDPSNDEPKTLIPTMDVISQINSAIKNKGGKIDSFWNLGDFINGYGTTKEEATEQLRTVVKAQEEVSSDFHNIMGNHDNNEYATLEGRQYTPQPETEILSISELNTVLANNTTTQMEHHNEQRPTDYYVDFDTIRIICLSADATTFQSETVNWLKDEALRTDKEVLFLAHIPTRPEWGYHNDIVNGDQIESAIREFTDANGTIIAFIHGHVHGDMICQVTDEKNETLYNEVAIGCARFQEPNWGDATPGITYQSRSEQDETMFLFDVITIDQTNKTVQFIRFGAGEDREINYR